MPAEQTPRPYASRQFRPCSPESLRVGDVVKGNGALWRIDGFRPSRAPFRQRDGRVQDEMVEVTCVDPCNSGSFSIGYTKQFVRIPIDRTWDRDVTENSERNAK